MAFPMLSDHPIAAIFPLLPEAKLRELAEDIKAHGLREPIVLHQDGRILDGRNRYRACAAANVEPVTRTWDGDGSPVAFVVSLNLHRRHLDESQRALVAARIANLQDGQRADRVGASIDAPAPVAPVKQADAASMLNVSRPSVQRARVVLDHGAPELVEAVERGDVKVSTAAVVAQSAPVDVQRDLVAEGPTAVREAAKAHVAFNSGNNEWYTPAHLVEPARAVMGGIDCDPASSDTANRTIQARVFHDESVDGLVQPWGERVWMNPPYAQPLIGQFIEGLERRVKGQEVRQACVLVNNATETEWGQRLLRLAAAVCLLRGRVRFIDPSGKPSGAPLQGQMLAYVGANPGAFVEAYSTHGVVVRRG